MKRKGPRAVPDFSRQASRRDAHPPTLHPEHDRPSAPRVAAEPPRVKPPATSAKNGQRGQ